MALSYNTPTSQTFAASSVTVTHTPSGTGNLLLIVVVTWRGAQTVSSYTWRGSSSGITKVAELYNGFDARIAMFYVPNPGATSGSFVVNFSGSVVGGTAGAYTVSSVDGTTPVPNSATNTGSSTSPSVQISGLTNGNDINAGVSAKNAPTLTSGDNEHWQQTSGSFTVGGTEEAEVTGTPQSNTWTLSVSNAWAAIGIEVAEASGGLSATIGQITEENTANSLTKLKAKSIDQLTEETTIQALSITKSKIIQQLVEEALLQSLSAYKAKAITQITEETIAQAIACNKTVAMAQVTQHDIAQVYNTIKTKSINQIAEDNITQAFTAPKIIGINQLTEDNIVNAMLWNPKIRVLKQVIEENIARAITVISDAAIKGSYAWLRRRRRKG
jgi:hypothetical protein